MRRTAATIHDDVLLDILFRVSTDVADLFRCAVTCKRWCALIADPSFVLRRRWPENGCHPSSLLGFFVQQRRTQEENAELSFVQQRRTQEENAELSIGMDGVDIESRQPPFFVPAQPRQPLGGRRRFLSSFVDGVPVGLLDGARPLTGRCGLLLVRLDRGSRANSVQLAVCDPLAGTCDVLPPLKCRVSSISCAILTSSDYCISDGLQQQRKSTRDYSVFFTVLIVVDHAYGNEHHEYDLYTFSSAKPRWSAPRRCFNETWQYGKGGFMMPPMWNRSGVVCRGTMHWLAAYMSSDGRSSRYHTFNVSIQTGDISLTELSIPVRADQLSRRNYGWLILTVAADRALSLFYVSGEKAGPPRLNIWTRRGDASREPETFWLRVGEFEVLGDNRPSVHMWLGEKSGTMIILDALLGRSLHKFDTETGVMEDVTRFFRVGLCIGAVPIEIDWPALFLSRLGGYLC